MDLKEFISNTITDIVSAIEETSGNLGRDVFLNENEQIRTIEFDVAVSAENVIEGEGKSGVRVLQVVDIGGKVKKENKNSTVSRIRFGVHVNKFTREQDEENMRQLNTINQQNMTNLDPYYSNNG